MQNVDFITTDNSKLMLTSRQPSNAGSFRRLAFTELANDGGKEKKQQVNPALRLPAGRWVQVHKNEIICSLNCMVEENVVPGI